MSSFDSMPKAIFGDNLWGDEAVRFLYMDEAGTSGATHETVRIVVSILVEADQQLMQVEAQADGPEHVLAFLLTPRAQLTCKVLKGLPVVCQMNVEDHVTINDISSMDRKSCLECSGFEERVRRLRLPESREHLGKEAMCVP